MKHKISEKGTLPEDLNPIVSVPGKGLRILGNQINTNPELYQDLLAYIDKYYKEGDKKPWKPFGLLKTNDLPYELIMKFTGHDIRSNISFTGTDRILQKKFQESLPGTYIYLIKKNYPRMFLTLWIVCGINKILRITPEDEPKSGKVNTERRNEVAETQVQDYRDLLSSDGIGTLPIQFGGAIGGVLREQWEASMVPSQQVTDVLLPLLIPEKEFIIPENRDFGIIKESHLNSNLNADRMMKSLIQRVYKQLQTNDNGLFTFRSSQKSQPVGLKTDCDIDRFQKTMLLRWFTVKFASTLLKNIQVTDFEEGLMDKTQYGLVYTSSMDKFTGNYRGVLTYFLNLRKYLLSLIHKTEENVNDPLLSNSGEISMLRRLQETRFYYDGYPQIAIHYYKFEHSVEIFENQVLLLDAVVFLDDLLLKYVDKFIYQETRGQLTEPYIDTIKYNDIDESVRANTCHCDFSVRNDFWRNVLAALYTSEVHDDEIEVYEPSKEKKRVSRKLIFSSSSLQTGGESVHEESYDLHGEGCSLQCVNCHNFTDKADPMKISLCGEECQKSTYDLLISMKLMNPKNFELLV